MDLSGFHHGIELFNRGEFYEAHEILEDVWRAAPVAEKLFLQALIQIAVALHHHSTGNSEGARSVLARAARNLAGYPDKYAGLRLDGLRRSVAAWREALENSGPAPELPKIARD